MPGHLISPVAAEDIASILAWTHDMFGAQARLRYEALLVRAIIDVVDKPERAGSHARPEIGAGLRTYHISYSRNRVSAAVGRVKRPRHLLLFRASTESRVEIVRVLHDSMDLELHARPR
jgi:toxin ParE1/3/4